MPDFLGMMKQAAQLQSKMQAMQEELGHVEVEGLAGGGLVAVRGKVVYELAVTSRRGVGDGGEAAKLKD